MTTLTKARLTDAEAEAAVLGAIVEPVSLTSDDFSLLMSLKPAFFWSEENRRVYAVTQALWSEGKHIDSSAVMFEVVKQGGSASSVVGIVATAAPAIGSRVTAYVDRVRDAHSRRALTAAAREVIARIDDGEETEAAADGLVAALQKTTTEGRGPVTIGVCMSAALELAERAKERRENGRRSAYPSSLMDIDERVDYKGGGLYVISGRPGMGKSAFMTQEMVSFAQLSKHCLLFSLEMPGDQVAMRACGILSGIHVSDAMRGVFDDMPRLRLGLSKIAALNEFVHIDDDPCVTVEAIERKARIMHARGKCDAVFVDYLQLIEPTAGKGKNGTREQEVAHMSRRLKLMAKSLNVPVFALAQMNRESEKRKGGEPTLADLRDSGAIEQDADCVMFPFRYGKYDEKAGDASAIIIGKNRNGETGKVDCRWSGKRMCFLESHDSDEDLGSPI